MTKNERYNWADLFDMKELHFALIAGLTFVVINQLLEFAVDRNPMRVWTTLIGFFFLIVEMVKFRKARSQADFLQIATLKHNNRRKK